MEEDGEFILLLQRSACILHFLFNQMDLKK